MISVIIPAYKEIWLQRTVDDILEKAEGDIEIIVCLDGYWVELKDNKKIKILHNGTRKGMRYSINSAARMAKGKYILKCDAHCAFDNAFDEVLKLECKPDWTVVPVRYSLDVKTWKKNLNKKYEFEYISQEDLKGRKWPEYSERVTSEGLPDLMTFQGSCWFMHRERFFEIGGLDEVNYGGMGREAQEICLKSWLSGGQCKLNRKTWYAHWSKGSKDMTYSNRDDKKKSIDYAVDIWKNNKWDKQTRKLEWLINHFSPVPTWEDVFDEDLLIKTPTIEEGEETILMSDKKLIIKKGMKRAGLYRYFAELGLKLGAEIGVQRGRNAKVMFDNIPNLSLFLIEPYADHMSNKRLWGRKTHEKFKRQAYGRFTDPVYNDRLFWIEKFSDVASYDIPDNTLDFVYIDGEHTYDFAMMDLILWSRKVRPGGIVAGHDFEYKGSGEIKKDPKVAHALLDFAKAYKIEQIYLTDKKAPRENRGDACSSWFYFKE